jgi:uncharacterized protein (TIGR02001 family)
MQVSCPFPAKVILRRWGRQFRRIYLCMREVSPARIGAGYISLAIATALCAPLHAQSSGINGAVGLSSQLVDRGIAITPATPTLQGAVSWTSPAGWSFGLLGSTEVRSPGHLVEASAQASRYWSLSSDWQMQASVLYYSYPGNARSRVFDRTETSINWIYRDILTFGLSAIHLIGASDQPRGAADLDLRWPLPWHFSLSAGTGVAQSLIAPHSPYGYGHASIYRYGHAGLAWDDGPWRIELDRITTDSEVRQQWGSPSISPWVATISRSF